jgi:NitT/TauT family transport system substrate-binding protein
MRRLIGIAAACAIALASVAASAQTKINIGYTNTGDFAGLFIAKEKGFFAAHGLDADLTLIALNSTIPSALVGGSIQIGGPTPTVLLQANDGGLDLVIAAGCATNNPDNKQAGVVARTGADIHKPEDFVGKKVGVPGIGAYLHVLFRQWLTDHKVDPKKVNFVEVPFAQGVDILKGGNVDAVLTAGPFFTRIIESKVGYLVSPYLAEMPAGISEIWYAATRDWASANADAVKGFRAALAEANEFQAKDPEGARAIIGKYMKVPPEVLKSLILSALDVKVSDQQVAWWVGVMDSQEMLKSKPSVSDLILP